VPLHRLRQNRARRAGRGGGDARRELRAPPAPTTMPDNLLAFHDIQDHFDADARIVVFEGDCLELLSQVPDRSMQLIVTSPPYNLGKEYEHRSSLESYLAWQEIVIRECHRVLSDQGNLCWQVGNYVEKGRIVPLDVALYPIFKQLGMQMRNRIVWHFEHGLHSTRRLSGRYETINWFTKTDEYYFDVDPIRVPQKYPGKKHFKGPKAGQYSSNPLGKNPGDVWVFPNVKSNHVEKTDHPCQYPVELVERLVLSMTRPDDWVFDPFLGVGSTIIGAVRHDRRGMGAETVHSYVDTACQRINQVLDGTLRVRAMNTPVFDPKDAGKSLTSAPWLDGNGHDESDADVEQLKLMQKKPRYHHKP
jgi:adenine-specific DNA-methyltransferase